MNIYETKYVTSIVVPLAALSKARERAWEKDETLIRMTHYRDIAIAQRDSNLGALRTTEQVQRETLNALNEDRDRQAQLVRDLDKELRQAKDQIEADGLALKGLREQLQLLKDQITYFENMGMRDVRTRAERVESRLHDCETPIPRKLTLSDAGDILLTMSGSGGAPTPSKNGRALLKFLREWQ